jgi:hypothetical protein
MHEAIGYYQFKILWTLMAQSAQGTKYPISSVLRKEMIALTAVLLSRRSIVTEKAWQYNLLLIFQNLFFE